MKLTVFSRLHLRSSPFAVGLTPGATLGSTALNGLTAAEAALPWRLVGTAATLGVEVGPVDFAVGRPLSAALRLARRLSENTTNQLLG